MKLAIVLVKVDAIPWQESAYVNQGSWDNYVTRRVPVDTMVIIVTVFADVVPWLYVINELAAVIVQLASMASFAKTVAKLDFMAETAVPRAYN